MLDTTKCVINNLNQFKYLKNRDRVHLKKSKLVIVKVIILEQLMVL